jgi:hypothetical protein
MMLRKLPLVLFLVSCGVSKETPKEVGCLCTREYRPTCVIVRSDTLVFANPCIARCNGYDELDFISCPDQMIR